MKKEGLFFFLLAFFSICFHATTSSSDKTNNDNKTTSSIEEPESEKKEDTVTKIIKSLRGAKKKQKKKTENFTDKVEFNYSLVSGNGWFNGEYLLDLLTQNLEILFMGLGRTFFDEGKKLTKEFNLQFNSVIFYGKLTLAWLFFLLLSLIKKAVHSYFFKPKRKLPKSIWLNPPSTHYHFFFPWSFKKVIAEIENMDLPKATLIKVERLLKKIEVYLIEGKKPPHVIFYGEENSLKIRRKLARILTKRFRSYQLLSGYFLSLFAKKDIDILHKVMSRLGRGWFRSSSCAVIDNVETLEPKYLTPHFKDDFLLIAIKNSNHKKEQKIEKQFRYGLHFK